MPSLTIATATGLIHMLFTSLPTSVAPFFRKHSKNYS